jgi:hypothetical protein
MNFVILLSNNFSISENRRWALIKRFLKDGLGPNVKVISDGAFLSIGEYSSIIIVESASEQEVINAMEPAKDVFGISISSVDLHNDSNQCEEFEYCLYSYQGEVEEVELNKNLDSDFVTDVKIHTRVDFKNHGAIESISLLKAPSILHAKFFGQLKFPNKHVLCIPIKRLGKFFQEKNDSENTKSSSEKENSTTDQPLINTETANSFTILNEGKEPFYCADAGSDELNYMALFKNQKKVIPGGTFTSEGTVFFWKSLTGSIAIYQTETSSVGNNVSVSHKNYSVPTKAATPILNLKPAPGTQLGINLDKGIDINNITDLNTWLNDLLEPGTHHKAWPNELYTGEDITVYNWFVKQLGAPPKNGTILPGLVNAIHFSPSLGFSLDSFNKVSKDLADICTYFQYTQEWFGSNGIFDSINSKVVDAQQSVLTSAANLMSISDNTSLTIFMESIIGDFLGVVSAIPKIGSGISAILRITFDGMKSGISSGSLSNSIKGEVAKLSLDIVDYLQIMVNTLAAKHKLINSDYGKLQEFVNGVIHEKISVDKLGISGVTGLNDKNGTVKLPQGYIEAAAKSWEIVYYKALFSVKPYPSERGINITSSASDKNLWDKKYYNFSYYLLGSWNDSSNHLKHGYFEFYCNYNAPHAALADIFGPRINLNPIELFLGMNGWPRMVDKFDERGDWNTITEIGGWILK